MPHLWATFFHVISKTALLRMHRNILSHKGSNLSAIKDNVHAL